MSWYSSIFASDSESDTTAREMEVSHASEVLDVAPRPYFVRLLAYLDEEADKPVAMGEKMLESAVEANTIKKLRAKIRRDIRAAQAVIDEVKRGS